MLFRSWMDGYGYGYGYGYDMEREKSRSHSVGVPVVCVVCCHMGANTEWELGVSEYDCVDDFCSTLKLLVLLRCCFRV